MDLSLKQSRRNNSHRSGFTTNLLRVGPEKAAAGRVQRNCLYNKHLWFSEDGQTEGPLAATSTLPKGVPKLILTQEFLWSERTHRLPFNFVSICNNKFCTYPSSRRSSRKAAGSGSIRVAEPAPPIFQG